jgi:hypothetical protein
MARREGPAHQSVTGGTSARLLRSGTAAAQQPA